MGASLLQPVFKNHGKVRAAGRPAPRARRHPARLRHGGVRRRHERAVQDLHLPRPGPKRVRRPHHDPPSCANLARVPCVHATLRSVAAWASAQENHARPACGMGRLPHCNPPRHVRWSLTSWAPAGAFVFRNTSSQRMDVSSCAPPMIIAVRRGTTRPTPSIRGQIPIRGQGGLSIRVPAYPSHHWEAPKSGTARVL